MSVTLSSLHPQRTVIAAGYLQKLKRRTFAGLLGDTAYTSRYFVLTKDTLYYFRKVGLYAKTMSTFALDKFMPEADKSICGEPRGTLPLQIHSSCCTSSEAPSRRPRTSG